MPPTWLTDAGARSTPLGYPLQTDAVLSRGLTAAEVPPEHALGGSANVGMVPVTSLGDASFAPTESPGSTPSRLAPATAGHNVVAAGRACADGVAAWLASILFWRLSDARRKARRQAPRPSTPDIRTHIQPEQRPEAPDANADQVRPSEKRQIRVVLGTALNTSDVPVADLTRAAT